MIDQGTYVKAFAGIFGVYGLQVSASIEGEKEGPKPGQ